MLQRIDASSTGALGGAPAPSNDPPAASGTMAPVSHIEPPVLPAGSVEAAVAEAMIAIDRARDRETALHADAAQRRFAEREAAIDDREKAARKKLAGGILGGLAKAAEGAASLVGAGGGSGRAAGSAGDAATGTCSKGVRIAQRTLVASESGLDIAQQGLGRSASASEADAARHDLRADAFKEAGDRAEGARSQSQQASNRLRDGLGEIERLRHEASTAALRG